MSALSRSVRVFALIVLLLPCATRASEQPKVHGVAFRSADAPVDAEISALLETHSARDVLVFLTAQRLIGSASHPDLSAAATAYLKFLTAYLEHHGLSVQPSLRSWDGFVRAYEALVDRPLVSAIWSGRQLDPTVTGSPLNDLARASDRIRDHWLLKAIGAALYKQDRIVVQFGAYHALAIEPVLEQIPSDCANAQSNAEANDSSR